MRSVRLHWGGVNLGGSKILRPIQHAQQVPFPGAKPLQHPCFTGIPQASVEGGEHRTGSNQVQQVADLVVRGDALDAEQGLRVAEAALGLHQLLVGQKRRVLQEERPKGSQLSIPHLVDGIVPRARLRQPAQRLIEDDS